MKLPKVVRRYCPYCKKHTEQKLKLVSAGKVRGALKRGSKVRAMKRGRARGMGSHGKYSKPAVSAWKRKTKSTKKTNILYVCSECNKATVQRAGKRTSKITLK